ncbi:hypothetical protein Mp_1g03660 [Marchantia polymorpha subsp. ruderalis]|uniref:Uncharacterized protein n=2 Tax=Marchantia polymorpha TaxID=3197 RepID=A0AAF6AL64_MARPO|nr:hypothetical protein MARPO_0005s0242 [Marchantia polymorpha]BBM97184.1 hypothetical protein Mp_1g03660 [Marchantia polymorpha subsp. ruderalis]|eukprot:PTQ48623.1 hypothetical protein MARPO_0005s0242 [Marchantia polymorpha]
MRPRPEEAGTLIEHSLQTRSAEKNAMQRTAPSLSAHTQGTPNNGLTRVGGCGREGGRTGKFIAEALIVVYLLSGVYHRGLTRLSKQTFSS